MGGVKRFFSKFRGGRPKFVRFHLDFKSFCFRTLFFFKVFLTFHFFFSFVDFFLPWTVFHIG